MKIKYPNDIPVPPKLMECSVWHDKQMAARNKLIEMAKKLNNPWFEKTLKILNNIKICKDDCMFCGTEVIEGKNWLFKKSCYGPDEMKLIRDFPVPTKQQPQACKKITDEALSQSVEIKLCTCDQDGCNTEPDNNTPSKEKKYQDDSDDANYPTILNQLLIIPSLFSILFHN